MRSLIFTLLFFSQACSSQALIREIKGKRPYEKSASYIFPEIIIQNNRVSTERINAQLQQDLLDIDKRTMKKSIFENVWGTKERPYSSLNDLSYSVLYNSKKFLSISITAEGCGAYCEYFTRYYSFDSKTGKKIIPGSLLTKKGLEALLDSMNKRKETLLKQKLAEITDSLNNIVEKDSSSSSKEDLTEIKELYTDCLERSKFYTTEDLNFYFTKTGLFIFTDRCSAHFNRAIDELDDFNFRFQLKDWRKHFTSFAKQLIN